MRRIVPACAIAAIAILYVLSLPSQPGSWDTGEMQTVPYLFGIAHPTGFPLFVILGYVFSHAVPLGTVAYRLNLMSALCMTGVAAALFACAQEMEIPVWIGAPAVLVFATTRIVWQHATRSEVHDLALLFLAILLAIVLRWIKSGDRRLLFAGAGAFAAAIATHAIAIMVLPALILALAFRRRDLRAWDLATTCGIAALGLALYAVIPLRSAYVVAHGLDPTQGMACMNGGIDWNFDDPSSLANFSVYVTGAQFNAGGTLVDALRIGGWPAGAWTAILQTRESFGTLGLALAIVGFLTLCIRRPRVAAVLALFGFAVVPFASAWSAVEGDPDRYRFLPMLVTALLLGAAGGALYGATSSKVRRALVAVALAGIVGFALHANWYFIGQNDAGSRRVISWASQGVPPGAIVVTPWLDATALGYGAYVDGTLAGRIVIASWFDTYLPCYAAWSKQRPVYVLTNVRLARPFVFQREFDDTHLLYRYVTSSPPSAPRKSPASGRASS